MKFFGIFSKPPARHVRGVSVNDNTDIKTPPGMGDDLALLHPSTASRDHSGLRDRIEEAVMLFSGGEVAIARSLLEEAMAGVDQGQDRDGMCVLAWQLQLELAHAAEDREGFEQLALVYAERFETSPPQWPGSRQRCAQNAHAACSTISTPGTPLSFRGRLHAGSAPALEQLRVLGARHPVIVLDLSPVSSIDIEGGAGLLAVLQDWQRSTRVVRLTGATALIDKTHALLSEGRRDPDDTAWQLWIELLRLSGDLVGYEAACLSYSLTYEISPPAAPPLPPLPALPVTAQPGAFPMPAIVRLPIEPLLSAVHAHTLNSSRVVLDCAALQRVDFHAAQPLLSGLNHLALGKTVELRDASHLVSVLLQLVGNTGALKILNRKP